MAIAAMKLNARGAANRHISSPLASKEYGVVCLHISSEALQDSSDWGKKRKG